MGFSGSFSSRCLWLERLFEAFQDDDPPYIESLGEHWGVLCAEPSLASYWADQLLPLLQRVFAERRNGVYAYTKAGTPCYSALFHCGRFDELIATLALDPKPYWHDQQWAAKALAARGNVEGAINLIEGLRSPYAPDAALSGVAEQLLLDAGRIDEAYMRYGVEATIANTNVATYRAIAKRYPSINPARILEDLIASTPGAEGKWFATAKTLKQYDLALALAQRSPIDPKTLNRAARDHVASRPAFALEVAMSALRWMAAGEGYELTLADVRSARDYALAAAEQLGVVEMTRARIAKTVTGHDASARWARQGLGLDEGN